MYEINGQHRHTLSINDNELAEQIGKRVEQLETINNVSQYFVTLARKDIQQGVVNDEL